jgi:hypothetical protein
MNISVIIPVHEYNDLIKSYLEKSIESVVKQENTTSLPKIIVVCPPNIENDIKLLLVDVPGATVIVNNGDTSYQAQVNLAVESIETDYFTVLEFDDEFSTTYFNNVIKHINAYPDIDVFLSMLIEVNEKNEGIKVTNETVWAQQFVGENGEMGYLNANALKQYTDFKLSGAVIKKSEFINLGRYKVNIKLAFMYEFLLRALNNACKVYTIPKIGYKHLATRENSLFDNYLKTMPVNERKFWFDTATTEANFITDRQIDMTRLSKLRVV